MPFLYVKQIGRCQSGFLKWNVKLPNEAMERMFLMSTVQKGEGQHGKNDQWAQLKM